MCVAAEESGRYERVNRTINRQMDRIHGQPWSTIKKHSPQCQHLSRIARISRARPRSSTTFTWTNPTSFIHIWLSSSYYSVKLNGDSLIFNPFILPLLSNPKRNLRERWIVMNEPKIVTSPVKKPDYTAET